MVKDIQMLEKKVNILKESVIQLNKAYYKYAKDVDMNDLMQQVKDMVTRTQVMEKKALAGNPMDEKAVCLFLIVRRKVLVRSEKLVQHKNARS
uniref:AH domain-containing protein n=1 Tax=Caenorhabditis tropicalis TaxID=1561998 RepID=A0A1I7TU33_9PELO